MTKKVTIYAVASVVLAAGLFFAANTAFADTHVSVKNNNNAAATGGTVTQSQSQSQSQSSSSNSSQSQSQSQSQSSTGGSASVSQSSKTVVDIDKDHDKHHHDGHGDKGHKKGSKKLPATGTGMVALAGIIMLALLAAIAGIKRFSKQA